MERALSTPARATGLSEPDQIKVHLERIIRDAFTDCWHWPGSTMGRGAGYGHVWIGGRLRTLHVLLWERLHGPVPPGLELDHLCRNTRCCNPDHLEAITHRENILRGDGTPAKRARQTHCKRGHEFTPENTIIGGPNRTYRKCRACERARKRGLL